MLILVRPEHLFAKDSRDDPGYAFRVAAVHQTSFGRDSIKWNMEVQSVTSRFVQVFSIHQALQECGIRPRLEPAKSNY
ncbi:MAG: hypothetical protein R2850_09600 [Bacteroidia bacterium]